MPAPRQPHRELGERADFAVDRDRAAMLLRDDVVADRETKPGAFTRGLGRKERLEQAVAMFGRDADAVIAHANLDGVAQITRRHLENGTERAVAVALALVGGIETVA